VTAPSVWHLRPRGDGYRDARREDGFTLALGRVAAELEQRRADASAVADEVWLANQWLEQWLAAAEGRPPD
jgi:hypothetical protein